MIIAVAKYVVAGRDRNLVAENLREDIDDQSGSHLKSPEIPLIDATAEAEFSTSAVAPDKKSSEHVGAERSVGSVGFVKLVTSSGSNADHQIAFPGAEGFGAQTKGGRGGQVIEVTNLLDDGPGSLRMAIETSGPRIVVFRIAGTIVVSETLEIEEPFITIAGQSAPGEGITIRNAPSNDGPSIRVETHEVIIRYLRVRPGASTNLSDQVDALSIGHPDRTAHNVIVDHSSFSWGTDETVQTWYDSHDITFQWNIISESLDCSTHSKGCHSKGMLIGSRGAGRISIHHNLFAHNRDRNPMVKTSGGTVDVVNNLFYNIEHGSVSYDNYGIPLVNLVANVYIDGPNSDMNRFEIDGHTASDGEGPFGHSIFVQGNLSSHRKSDMLAESDIVQPDVRDFIVTERHDAPLVTTTSATEAYSAVLDNAGAIQPRRDQIDVRIVNDVIERTGHLINDVAEVGGWQIMSPGVAINDADHDGMPDEWEAIFGLDPNDSSDSSGDLDGDGFTNVEEYLNDTSP